MGGNHEQNGDGPKTIQGQITWPWAEERIQKASMGQILGPDYDLVVTHLEKDSKIKARERIKKFLHDHKWLREAAV